MKNKFIYAGIWFCCGVTSSYLLQLNQKTEWIDLSQDGNLNVPPCNRVTCASYQVKCKRVGYQPKKQWRVDTTNTLGRQEGVKVEDLNWGRSDGR